MDTTYTRADIGKRHIGPEWFPPPGIDLPVTRSLGWQSHGGFGRLHPAKALPVSLTVELPTSQGRVEEIQVVGVFALYSDHEHEAHGATGAMIEVVDSSGESFRVGLQYGPHYFNALEPGNVDVSNADGTSLRTIDRVQTEEGSARVDVFSIAVPPNIRPRRIVFRDMMTQASFIVFHVLTKSVASPVCPFRGHGGRFTFQELGAVLRGRDREKFDLVLAQTTRALATCEDTDEARGAAMLFLANICAHTLDMGGPRSRHRYIAVLARTLESCKSIAEVSDRTVEEAEELVSSTFGRPVDSSAETIRRALEIVAKGYSTALKDAEVAQELGLSPSHFRYLFRQQTSKPFHQYVLTYRLNRAKDLLRTTQLTIQQVAQACGFTSQAHFCRAFAKHAEMVPTAFREKHRGRLVEAG
jgi:AraC-like DNA-binding protein